MEGPLEPLSLLVPNAVRFLEVNNIRYLLGPDLARLVKRAFLALKFCVKHMIDPYREGLAGDSQVENPAVNMYAHGGMFSTDAQSQDEQSLLRELKIALKLLPVKPVDDVNEIDEFSRYEDFIRYSLPLCTQIALVTPDRIEPLRMSLLGEDHCLIPILFRILTTAMSNVREHLPEDVAVGIFGSAQQYIGSKDTAKTEYPEDHIMRFLCTDMVPFAAQGAHKKYFGVMRNYNLQGETALWIQYEERVRPFKQKALEFELMLTFCCADGGYLLKAQMDQASKTDQSLMDVLKKYAARDAVHKQISRGMGEHNYVEVAAMEAILAFTKSDQPLPTVVRALPTFTKAEMGDNEEDKSTSMATLFILAGVVGALYLTW